MKLAVIYMQDGDDSRDLIDTQREILDCHPDALIAPVDALDRTRLEREFGAPIDWGLAELENYRNFDVWEIQSKTYQPPA